MVHAWTCSDFQCQLQYDMPCIKYLIRDRAEQMIPAYLSRGLLLQSQMVQPSCEMCPSGFFIEDDGKHADNHEKCTLCPSSQPVVNCCLLLFVSDVQQGRWNTSNISEPCSDCPVGWKGLNDGEKWECLQKDVNQVSTGERGSRTAFHVYLVSTPT